MKKNKEELQKVKKMISDFIEDSNLSNDELKLIIKKVESIINDSLASLANTMVDRVLFSSVNDKDVVAEEKSGIGNTVVKIEGKELKNRIEKKFIDTARLIIAAKIIENIIKEKMKRLER